MHKVQNVCKVDELCALPRTHNINTHIHMTMILLRNQAHAGLLAPDLKKSQ